MIFTAIIWAVLYFIINEPPNHLLAPLVPFYITGVLNSVRSGRDRKLTKTLDWFLMMTLLGFVVIVIFTVSFYQDGKKYTGQLVMETMAATVALVVFKTLKLDRNPAGEEVILERFSLDHGSRKIVNIYFYRRQHRD